MRLEQTADCHCGQHSKLKTEDGRMVCTSCHRALWQPIDTAPKDGQCFIGYFNDEKHGHFYQMIGWDVYAHMHNREPSWLNSCNESWDGFTHWMPLPTPPKKRDE